MLEFVPFSFIYMYKTYSTLHISVKFIPTPLLKSAISVMYGQHITVISGLYYCSRYLHASISINVFSYLISRGFRL